MVTKKQKELIIEMIEKLNIMNDGRGSSQEEKDKISSELKGMIKIL